MERNWKSCEILKLEAEERYFNLKMLMCEISLKWKLWDGWFWKGDFFSMSQTAQTHNFHLISIMRWAIPMNQTGPKTLKTSSCCRSLSLWLYVFVVLLCGMSWGGKRKREDWSHKIFILIFQSNFSEIINSVLCV